VTGVAAGLHALLELPPGLDEDEIIARAAACHDLALDGLRP
jgi:DNA-binding transcriptional MocR family regulator